MKSWNPNGRLHGPWGPLVANVEQGNVEEFDVGQCYQKKGEDNVPTCTWVRNQSVRPFIFVAKDLVLNNSPIENFIGGREEGKQKNFMQRTNGERKKVGNDGNFYKKIV